jgi:DNA-binding protein H-NS
MKRSDFASMSSDELWMLHEEIAAELAAKIRAEKKAIENRLSLLVQNVRKPERRPYPIVLPKFRNPAEPSQTWAGRGKQPRWLTAQLRSGKRIDDFRIAS